MSIVEEPYLQLIRDILEKGHEKSDRTGTGTKSLFGYQMRFNLAEGFPLLTTKKVPFGLIKSELLWFLRGDTNIDSYWNIIIIFGMNGHLRIGFKVMNIMDQI